MTREKEKERKKIIKVVRFVRAACTNDEEGDDCDEYETVVCFKDYDNINSQVCIKSNINEKAGVVTSELFRKSRDEILQDYGIFGGTGQFFATRPENVARSPLDIYFLAHLMMGQIAFLFFLYLIGWINAWAFWATVLFGIVWEPIENFVVFEMGIKFDNGKDSIINSFFDMIFVLLGATIAYFIESVVVLTWVIVIEFTIWFILYSRLKRKNHGGGL